MMTFMSLRTRKYFHINRATEHNIPGLPNEFLITIFTFICTRTHKTACITEAYKPKKTFSSHTKRTVLQTHDYNFKVVMLFPAEKTSKVPYYLKLCCNTHPKFSRSTNKEKASQSNFLCVSSTSRISWSPVLFNLFSCSSRNSSSN